MKRILIIVGISLAAIVLAVSLLVSPIAKSYIEKHSPELIGRQVTISKLCINIFTGGVKIQGFALAAEEGSDSTSFVELDTISTRIRILPMLSSKFIVKKLHMSGLRVNVWQNEDKFNFDDILAKFPADTAKEEEAPSSWAIGVYDIQLRDSRVSYRDIAVGSDFDMNDISLDIPGVYFSEKSTDVGLRLKFAKGGELATTLVYDIPSSQYKLNLKFRDYNIDAILPYIKQQFNIGKIEGFMTTDITVVGDMDHIMEFAVGGSAEIRDIVATNTSDVKLITAKKIRTNIREVSLVKENYMIDSLVAEGVSALFEIGADGKNNFSTLFKESVAIAPTAPTAPATTPVTNPQTVTVTPKFEIGVFDFNGGSVEIRDNMVPRNFAYDITSIDCKTTNFNVQSVNNLKLTAMMNGSGSAQFKWKGKLDDKNNQNITVRLSNVNLKPLTPYMMQYFAYPIQSGSLSFTSQNIISRGMLNGTNHLEAYKVEVGKRDKALKPEYKIPFKTVLYVLSDKNDRIDMSLPVSGNINSPEFSYRKLIIKTILNLMVKVATAPFDFMGGALGLGKGTNLQQLEFSASQSDFTLEQYAKMKDIAATLQQHAELDITFTQNVNCNAAVQALAVGELKKNFYLMKNPSRADSLETIDYEAIRNISNKDPQLITYADSLVGAASTQPTLVGKAMTIYGSRAETLLVGYLQRLDANLKAFMEKEGIAKTHLIVASPTLEQMKAYNGLTMYKISIAMPGEQAMEAQLQSSDSTIVTTAGASSIPAAKLTSAMQVAPAIPTDTITEPIK